MGEPTSRPSEILSVAAVRRVDRLAADELGLPSAVLMENAGRGAVELAMQRFPPRDACLLAGAGNNGGDAWVAARHFLLRGVAVRVFATRGPDELAGDARIMALAAARLGIAYDVVREPEAWRRVAEEMRGTSLVVDGLLGTGVSGGARGAAAAAIAAFDALRDVSGGGGARPLVLALDVPSGLDAESGRAEGPVLRADHTVTFLTAKPGLVVPAAARFVGALSVAGIGVPADLAARLAPFRDGAGGASARP